MYSGSIGDLMSSRFNVKQFGAMGDGMTDDTLAIQAAIDFASNNGSTVFIPAGTYKVTGTLVLEKKVTLELTSSTVLLMAADAHIIQLKLDASVDGNGATIDTSHVTNFSHACIYMNADDFNSMTTSYVNDLNLFAGNGVPCPGYGIYLLATQPFNASSYAWISFLTSKNLKITGYNKGIYLQAVARSGANGGSWINGNNFTGFSIYNCINGVYLDGMAFSTANAVGGNLFTDFQIQTSSNMNRALYVTGDGNMFRGQIWDYTGMNLAGGALAVEFGGNYTSESNIVEAPFLDDTSTNVWKDGSNSKSNVVRSVTSSKVLLPTITLNPVFNGNQDDNLAFADRKFTVTQVSGPTIDTGFLGNAFNLDGDSDVSWVNVTAADPVVIVIDMTSAPLSYLGTFGILSKYDEHPINVKLETYDGTNWSTTFNVTGNYSSRLVQNNLNVYTVQQMRLTVSGSGASTNRLRLGKVFASATTPGGAFLTADGNTPVYGNFQVNGNLNVSGGLSYNPNFDDNCQNPAHWTITTQYALFSPSGTTMDPIPLNAAAYLNNVSVSPSTHMSVTAQVTATIPASLPDVNAGYNIGMQLYQNVSSGTYRLYHKSGSLHLDRDGTSLASVPYADTNFNGPTVATLTLSVDLAGNLTGKLYLGAVPSGTAGATVTAVDTTYQGNFTVGIEAGKDVLFTDAKIGAFESSNLVGSSITAQSYLTLGTVVNLPTASATYRGKVIVVQGNGTTTADIAYACMMSASGTYSWKPLVSG